jgi:hypothetical protein
MQNIIDRFKEVDLKQNEKVFQDWITQKTDTIQKVHKSTSQQLPIDPILKQLTDSQVDILISKVQKINKNYSEWKLMKNAMEKTNTKINKIQKIKEEKNAVLTKNLKELKQKQADLVFLEWKRQKNNKMHPDESLPKPKHKSNQPPKLKSGVNSIKEEVIKLSAASITESKSKEPKKHKPKMKLIRAIHNKPFSYETEHHVVKESTLSPPQLYSEQERYQKDYPDYYRKYKLLVASGK